MKYDRPMAEHSLKWLKLRPRFTSGIVKILTMAVRAPPCQSGLRPKRTAPDAGLSFAWHRQRPNTPGSLLARPDESRRPNPSKTQGPGLQLREDSPLYMSAAFMIGFPVALVGLLSTVRFVTPPQTSRPPQTSGAWCWIPQRLLDTAPTWPKPLNMAQRLQ
jgi:hypothetical protein